MMQTTNNNTLFRGRALFHVLLFMFLFSLLLFAFVNIEIEERELTNVRDLSNGNEVAAVKHPMTALTHFVRRNEPLTLSISSDEDDVESNALRSFVCRKIEGPSDTSFQRVWEQIKPSIVKVSLIDKEWTKNIRSMKNFTDWVDESMSYFTYSRMQHTSLSRPIDQTRSIGRIHSILEEKMRFPKTAPPLRIVVFGGSVTNGRSCMDNKFNFDVRNDSIGGKERNTPTPQAKLCAWPGRLQDMMDETFGLGVVEIQNLAVAGAKSDVSAAFMGFGLIPGSTPDIIIWDHGINDAMTTINPNVNYEETSSLDTEQIFEKLQNFYQAAISLPTSCDNPDPPLVIMLDSLLGHQTRFPQISEALRISSAVSKMLTWYPDIWGISSANTIRPYILSKVSDEQKMIGLLGSPDVSTHPGMMYHISIAWVLMFNVLNALHDNCVTRDISPTTSSSTEISKPVDEGAYLQLSLIPELNAELRMVDIPALWNERIPEQLDYETCLDKQMAQTEAMKKFTNHSSLTCYYVWIVNSMLSDYSPEDIQAKIEPYLVSNEGWTPNSMDNARNRGGWVASGGWGSFFEMQFSDVPTTVTSLSLVYMKSYSQMWINATLQIDCLFFNPSIDGSSEFPTLTDSNTPRILDQNDTLGMISRTESYSSIRHFISGYHDDETSILVPVKLSLPDRTLEEGKSALRLHFRLVDGETFKIAGMALC